MMHGQKNIKLWNFTSTPHYNVLAARLFLYWKCKTHSNAV